MKKLHLALLTLGFSIHSFAGSAPMTNADLQEENVIYQHAIPFDPANNVAVNTQTVEDPPAPAIATGNTGARELSVNTTSQAQSYPWISDDALRVYYTHDVNMYMASRKSALEPFSAGKNIMPDLELTIISGWLTPDELTIYFATQSSSLYVAHRASRQDNFNEYQLVKFINAPEGSLFDASFTPDMNELFMYNNSNKEQIVRFEKTGDNEYTYKEVVHFNSGSTPTGGQLSRDGLRFYVPLRITEDVNDDNRKIYVASRTEMHGDFTTLEEVKFTEPMQITAYQPSVSADGTHIIFVSGHDNLWDNNDLYEANMVADLTQVYSVAETPVESLVAEKIIITPSGTEVSPDSKEPGIIIAVTESPETKNTAYETPGQKETVPVTAPELNVYPNPFSDQTTVSILVPESGYLKVEIYNVSGQYMGSLYDGQTEGGLKILSWFRNASNSVLSNGVYTVKALVNKTVVTKKVVVCDGPMH